VADQPSERPLVPQLAPQDLDFPQRVEPLHDLVEQEVEPLRIDRLGQVVVRAGLDRFDRRFDLPCASAAQNDVGVVRAEAPKR
jgi:hypothetical protein